MTKLHEEWDHYDDYDEPYPCDHIDYEADILTGIATCDMCGHRWMQTDQQRAAERKAQAAYDKMCEEWDRNPPEPPLTLQPTGDDIPF